MHRCQVLFKFLIVLLLISFSALAEPFLAGTEDVPLMKGMQYSADETFSIDNEDGRLYFSKTFISEKSDKIWAFYRETLPQLGWQEKHPGLFEREGEVLRIGVVDETYHAEKQTTVIFELITKSK